MLTGHLLLTKSNTPTHEFVADVFERIVQDGLYRTANVDEQELLSTYGFEMDGEVVCFPPGFTLLNEAEIRRYINLPVEVQDVELVIANCVASTNSLLYAAAAHRNINNLAMLAELQVAGRGRYGRTWHSLVGRNIALSLGCRLGNKVPRISILSLVVGITVAELLEQLSVPNVQLKWPNDILVDRRKVGGILIELVDAATSTCVIGIGLNLGTAPEIQRNDQFPVGDLAQYVDAANRNRIVGMLINGVWHSINQYAEIGWNGFRDRWKRFDVLDGHKVTNVSGETSIYGTACGISPTGALLVKDCNANLREITHGEIVLNKHQR